MNVHAPKHISSSDDTSCEGQQSVGGNVSSSPECLGKMMLHMQLSCILFIVLAAVRISIIHINVTYISRPYEVMIGTYLVGMLDKYGNQMMTRVWVCLFVCAVISGVRLKPSRINSKASVGPEHGE